MQPFSMLPKAVQWGTVAALSVAFALATAKPAAAAELSRRIDQILEASWQGEANAEGEPSEASASEPREDAPSGGSIVPAPRADDAEFLRRVYLDLVGTIPPAGEARAFLFDPSEDKRERLIDRLLRSPRHAQHLADVWTRILLQGSAMPDQGEQLNRWLLDRFARNLRYDRLVADLLAADGASEPGPVTYFQAMEFAPSKLAASSSRIFLGIRLECAECHDHPFDHWTQRDFWGYAAFFAQVNPDQSNMRQQVGLVDRPGGGVTLPGRDEVVNPRFPNGRDANLDSLGTRRQWLALWMASPENNFLARAAVNRVWGHLFGRALVEPVDDMSPMNPASHPELLDALADAFVESGYDLRYLYREILNSDAYQRSSRYERQQVPPAATFAVMAPKPLSVEQLARSLAGMLGSDGRDASMLVRASLRQIEGPGGRMEASIPGALLLINGDTTARIADVDQGVLLRALAAPFLSPEERLDAMFLGTLSRLPTDEERQRLLPLLVPVDGAWDASKVAEAALRPEEDVPAEALADSDSAADSSNVTTPADDSLANDSPSEIVAADDPSAEESSATDPSDIDPSKVGRSVEDKSVELAAEDILWAILNSAEFLHNH